MKALLLLFITNILNGLSISFILIMVYKLYLIVGDYLWNLEEFYNNRHD